MTEKGAIARKDRRELCTVFTRRKEANKFASLIPESRTRRTAKATVRMDVAVRWNSAPLNAVATTIRLCQKLSTCNFIYLMQRGASIP